MKIDFEHLRGKGPLIISVIAATMLFTSFVSLFFYPKTQTYEDLTTTYEELPEVVEDVEPDFYYDISSEEVSIESGKIKRGESLTSLLGRYGMTAADIYKIDRATKKVFDSRRMRAGNKYDMLISKADTTLSYFIYNIDNVEYVKYTFKDTIMAERIKRPVETNRKTLQVDVKSSLWESVVAAGGSASLVSSIEDIFQWTIDFYGIRPGDSFSFVYDEEFVDGKSLGISDIIATSYTQRGKSIYAFLYESNGKRSYWDEDGKSLKRAFLKAPLRFSRISSKFTYRRLHPVHKVYKAHTGVDYAAPSGTPVMSIADGIVTDKFYNRGGGNTLKIKHYIAKGSYVSGYLHLRGYAKGIKKGSKVTQGQVIGYVGSTGVSTGPHLDFRIWRNGKPIDPLKLDDLTGDPLSSNEMISYKTYIEDSFNTLKALQERAEKGITDSEKEKLELERERLDREERQNSEQEHDI